MAQINININAYFTPKRPKHMIDYKDNREEPSTEALWFSCANVLEYIESVGIKKSCYIGLIGYDDFYITRTGEHFGIGALSELADAAHPLQDTNKIYKKIFEASREIYLKSEISKDKTQLYQFSKEDTIKFVKQVFEHEKYGVSCKG